MAEEVEGQENQNESPQEKGDKISKKYAVALAFVTKIVGGEKNLLPAKNVDGNTVAGVVADLFKEEREQLVKDVKEKLKNLLKKHVEFARSVSSKRKELDQVEQKGKEEFTKAVNDFIQLINREEINSEAYGVALKAAFEPSEAIAAVPAGPNVAD